MTYSSYHLIEIYGYINISTKKLWHQNAVDRHLYSCVSYIFTQTGLNSLWIACIIFSTNNSHLRCHNGMVQLHATFLFGFRRWDKLRYADYRDVFRLKHAFYQLTRRRIHKTLIVINRYLQLVGDYKNPLHLDVVDRYLRRMGDKTIPDEAPPSLKSFYPPWVAGIDLPQSRWCGFLVSFTNKHKLKCILRLNTGTSAFGRLSHRRHPNKEVALNCMRRYGDGVTVICDAK